MKRRLLVFLGLFAVATAMVPLERRAVNAEEEETASGGVSTTPTTTPKPICAPQTPCGWSVYKSAGKMVKLNMTNSYCTCSPGLECLVYENDTSVSAYIHRCRPPPQEESEYSHR